MGVPPIKVATLGGCGERECLSMASMVSASQAALSLVEDKTITCPKESWLGDPDNIYSSYISLLVGTYSYGASSVSTQKNADMHKNKALREVESHTCGMLMSTFTLLSHAFNKKAALPLETGVMTRTLQPSFTACKALSYCSAQACTNPMELANKPSAEAQLQLL